MHRGLPGHVDDRQLLHASGAGVSPDYTGADDAVVHLGVSGDFVLLVPQTAGYHYYSVHSHCSTHTPDSRRERNQLHRSLAQQPARFHPRRNLLLRAFLALLHGDSTTSPHFHLLTEGKHQTLQPHTQRQILVRGRSGRSNRCSCGCRVRLHLHVRMELSFSIDYRTGPMASG